MIEGTLRLRDARIEGALILKGTHWRKPLITVERKPRITEERNGKRNNFLLAQGLSVLGEVNIAGRNSTVAAWTFVSPASTTFDAPGARIYNRTGEYALNMNGAVIQGNLRLCEGFHSAGLVRIDRAQIIGMLTLGAQLEAPDNKATETKRLTTKVPTLTACEATVAAGLRLLWSSVEGHVNLSGLRTSRFTDISRKYGRTASVLVGCSTPNLEIKQPLKERMT